MAETTKIFTVCLASPRKYKAYAVYNGETLMIAAVTPITGLFNSWRDAVIEEVKEKVAQGFIVLVEERTDVVSRHATQYLLEDMNHEEEKRSNYFDALDWYFALQATDNIMFDASFQQFAFTGSSEGGKIERTQDDKGRSVYRVNWTDFHGGYRAVLLCVVAAMTEPLSERYITEMFKHDQRALDITSPAHRFTALMMGEVARKGKELEKAQGVE